MRGALFARWVSLRDARIRTLAYSDAILRSRSIDARGIAQPGACRNRPGVHHAIRDDAVKDGLFMCLVRYGCIGCSLWHATA